MGRKHAPCDPAAAAADCSCLRQSDDFDVVGFLRRPDREEFGGPGGSDRGCERDRAECAAPRLLDASGCQGTARTEFRNEAWPEIAGACPDFSLPDTVTFAVINNVAFSPPIEPEPTTLMRAFVAKVYFSPTNFNVTTEPANAATRYFLGAIRFDHQQSVVGAATLPTQCGGYDTPMSFRLYNATWVDENGFENDFDRPAGSVMLSFNVPTAIQATTWGQVRNQYRR